MSATYKAQAIRLGREHGLNAAGWWTQENGGGRDTRGARELGTWAASVLQGIEDCDPEIMDALPAPDLSGQWADGMTPEGLADEVGLPKEGPGDRACTRDDRLQELCDEYENAFQIAANDEIGRHLRRLVRGGK